MIVSHLGPQIRELIGTIFNGKVNLRFVFQKPWPGLPCHCSYIIFVTCLTPEEPLPNFDPSLRPLSNIPMETVIILSFTSFNITVTLFNSFIANKSSRTTLRRVKWLNKHNMFSLLVIQWAYKFVMKRFIDTNCRLI